MKISSLARGFHPELDERKRSQLRKEASEVYKKHAKYTNAGKNPLLQALENLLSGKTEKDLLTQDNAGKAENRAAESTAVYTQAAGPEQSFAATIVPSSQDLLAAANSSTATLPLQANEPNLQPEPVSFEEAISYANADLSFTMPERFQQGFARNPDEQTIFGQQLEKGLFQRTFNHAVQTYSAQMAMVNNGYRSVQESIFSQIA